MVESRLKATADTLGESHLPRIIRICRKFQFTKNETSIALYCATRQLVQKYEEPQYGLKAKSLDAKTISGLLDIPILEVLGFIRKDRLHMKQGLFPETLKDSALSGQIAYEFDFLLILIGSKVTDNVFLKLKNTFMGDVILEEPRNKHLK